MITLTRPADPPQPAALPITCSECGEDYPAVCPDLCDTTWGTLPSGPPPPRRRPFRILAGGRVAA